MNLTLKVCDAKYSLVITIEKASIKSHSRSRKSSQIRMLVKKRDEMEAFLTEQQKTKPRDLL